MFNLASTNMDRFLVTHFFGAAIFGIYSNASVEIPTVSVVMQATNVVLLAEYSRLTAVNDEHGLHTLWRSANIKTAILVLASLGFLAFWARETMLLVFSRRFAESGEIFRILVWTIPLYIVSLRSLFIAHGATLLVLRLTIIGLGISLLCTLTGGRFFGIHGIATGLVIGGYLINALWIGTYIRHFSAAGWQRFLPWRELGTILLLTLLAGGITRLLGDLVVTAWPLLAVYAIAVPVYLLLYFAGLYVTGLYHFILPARFRRQPSVATPVA